MIKAEDIGKTYYQGSAKIEAVKNASLEIQRKESVLITGPSGAGKSTLLHMLGGLDKPTKGALFFDGADFYGLGDKKRAEIRNQKMGFVFQFYHLLPEFSVLENVMLPSLIKRKDVFRNKKDIRKRAQHLLGIVGLAPRMRHRPAELSGGESQRAAIARALINFPEVLLCDEPTGNLDSKVGKEIIDYLWFLKERENMALVIVTHDEEVHDSFNKKFKIKDGSLEKTEENKVLGYGL